LFVARQDGWVCISCTQYTACISGSNGSLGVSFSPGVSIIESDGVLEGGTGVGGGDGSDGVRAPLSEIAMLVVLVFCYFVADGR
jgi:hypothetical protein